MGGSLPTASTPGYTYFPAKYGPDVACVCLAEWFPVFRRLCELKGLGTPVVWQATGDNPLSVGSHSKGGTFDVGGIGRARIALGREMGAWAFWERDWENNVHSHGVLAGCPHLSDLSASQLREVRADGDGLKGDGQDPFPDPKTYRTWQQGIAWANVEIERLDDMFTDEDRLNLNRALSAITGLRSEEAGRYSWSVGKLNDILTASDLDESEVQAIVSRLDDAGRLEALTAKVDTLTAAVSNLLTLVQESHPKADPDPEPAPLPVPATQYGVDVSGHQTLAQVQAACANAKYGFVIVKATEGLSYDSPAYAAQIAAVRDAGECAGAYHFAWPNQDPLKEAEHFVRVAALKPGELACLDVENWPEITDTPWTQRLTYTLAWLREVKRLTGSTPLVYANWDWIKGLRTAATVAQWDELVTFPLWIAQYRTAGTFDTVSPKTGSANGWPVVMHQWTNNDGGLDGNFMPDPAAWSDYAVR